MMEGMKTLKVFKTQSGSSTFKVVIPPLNQNISYF